MKDLERLRMYYLAGRAYLPRPRYLCFNSTMRCDGRCGHCGIWKHRPVIEEIGAERLGPVLGRPFFGRIETAWITGGEPTLREDVGELAGVMARSLPSLVTLGLTTNGFDPGRVLDRVTAMERVLVSDAQGLFIQVSVDGVGEVHDRARGRDGLFAAVAETLDRLADFKRSSGRRVEIGLNCVVQPVNVAGLDELHTFARERGLGITFNVAVVTDQIYHNRERAAELTLTAEQAREAAEFLGRIMESSPPALRYQYRTMRAVLAGGRRPSRCLTLYSTININANGTLIPCPASSSWLPRNVAEEDAETVWRGAEARAMRRRVERELCPGCMLSCSLGDAMPVSEWLAGGWDR